jgi:hypothetical protein
VADAQAAITAAQANVRQTVLSSKPEYRVALAARDAARQASDKTQKDTAATPEQMTQASNDVMTADSAVAQLEAAAFNADAGCKDAKDKYNAAVAALALMRKTFDEGLKSDPAITAAKSAVDQATVKVASAQAAVNDTQKDYATAMQALYLAQNPPPTAKK